jgi:hypothetical protein
LDKELRKTRGNPVVIEEIPASFCKNFLHRHAFTENNTLCFGRKLFPSSGEETNPETLLNKNIKPTSTQFIREKQNPMDLTIYIPNTHNLITFRKTIKFKICWQVEVPDREVYRNIQ